MAFQVQFAGLDLREVEDVVDDVEERVGGAADGLDEVALLVGQLGVHQQRGHADDAVHRRADLVAGVGEELGLGARGFLKLLVEGDECGVAVHQLLLALAQRAVGLVALDGALIGLGVVADAGDEFDLVGQLDEVVVRAGGEGLGLDSRLFLGGKDDDGRLLRAGVGAELPDKGQPVNARHDQVLKDDGGLDLVRQPHRLRGVDAVVEVDVRLIGEAAPDGFGHHDLIVHQQHHDRVVGWGGVAARRGSRPGDRRGSGHVCRVIRALLTPRE